MVRRVPKDVWPSWRHGPNGESAIFQREEDVPYGWTKKKHQEFEPVAPIAIDYEAVKSELIKRGIEIDPRWGNAHLKKVLDEND